MQNAEGRELVLAEGGFAIRGVRESDKRALGVWSEGATEGTKPRILGNYDLSAEGSRCARGEGAFVVSSRGAVGVGECLLSFSSSYHPPRTNFLVCR